MTNTVLPPPPPVSPPNREFRTSWLGGILETKESIQRRRDYEIFMKGWRYALTGVNTLNPGKHV